MRNWPDCTCMIIIGYHGPMATLSNAAMWMFWSAVNVQTCLLLLIFETLVFAIPKLKPKQKLCFIDDRILTFLCLYAKFRNSNSKFVPKKWSFTFLGPKLTMFWQFLGNLPTILESNGPIGPNFYRRIALTNGGTGLQFQVSW